MIVYGASPPSSSTIGGKAQGLFRLRKLGVLVPDFLVIPAETFDPALLAAPPPGSDAAGPRQRLLAHALPAPDQGRVAKILAAWGFPGEPVVVRSSIADEDGEKDAFPGMMDSFLNLHSLPEVWDAVSRCAASAYAERVVAYRQQKGLTQAARPAVIVQRQVRAEASGVLFTTFPEYPQEMAIHAVWGFGEGLVGGLLEPDEFYLLKKTGLLHRQKIAQKELLLQADPGIGLQEAAVTQERQGAPCLCPEVLQELYRVGAVLEKALAGPQDVEFAVAGNQVVLLQARPVTQAIPEVVVYDNANIQESYCGVTTPLTFSFASRAYATVYRQTMQVLGLPQPVIEEREEMVTHLLGLVKGRIYYHINHWYQGLQLLPSFKQNKADMEKMMGLQEPVDFVVDQEKTLPQKLRLLPGLLLNLSRLLWAFSRLPHRVAAFHAHFRHHYGEFYLKQTADASLEHLLEQKRLLDQKLLLNWTTPIINDFYVMMMNGRVQRKLKKAGITDPEEFLSRFLSGDQEIESTQPTRAMQRIAALAWPEEELRRLLLALPEDVHAEVREKYPAFFSEVQAFIGLYGDRTVGELKLETLTMRIQPIIFYKYLRNYLAAEAPPAAVAAAGTPFRQEAERELAAALATRPRLWRRGTWGSLQKLQQAIRYRESLRLERTRLFGMYRAVYLALGAKLQETAVLPEAREVFYLTEEEILQAVRQPGPTGWADLVASRKKEFEAFKKEQVPSRVTVPSPPVAAEAVLEEMPGRWQGTGCYRGEAEGEVIVITDPGDDLDVRGKIVCALRTDPGWAALFPACRGVIIQKGSSLSHSVILLRELGIPTIINVPRLTDRLQSGQRIRMNGSTGEIQLIDDESDDSH